MKNIIIGVLAVLFIGYVAINETNKEKDISPCGHDIDFVADSFQDWLTSAIKERDTRIQNNPILIKNIVGVMEYSSIPEVMNIALYEDFKNSRVCKATLIVNYTPNEEVESLEQIDVRFQKILTSPNEDGEQSINVAMAGYDVKEMGEQGIKFFRVHNKDKK